MKKSLLKENQHDILKEYGINHIRAGSVSCFHYEAGEAILLEGMPMLYVYLVISGKAKVCVSAVNGRDFVLSHYISNGVIGDVELMTNRQTASTSIIAVTEFTCIALPCQIYAKSLKSNLCFLNRIGFALSEKLLHTTRSCQYTALHTGEERLCSYIAETSVNGLFCEALTDVSCSIGISYRHLFRILNQLCRDGIIRKLANGYRITNPEELAKRIPPD